MNSRADQFEQIAGGLAEHGYSIIDKFLTPRETKEILALEEFKSGVIRFKRAGIGSRKELKINEGIRGDYIQWIDNASQNPALKIYTGRLRDLIHYLNANLFLSLKDFEVHLTVYPPGSFYRRHLDQFKGNDHRRLSVILYLNEDWMPDYGGQLRMHLPAGPQDVLPLAGRLVCFRSDIIEHEVLPATRTRLSITGWILDQLTELRHL